MPRRLIILDAFLQVFVPTGGKKHTQNMDLLLQPILLLEAPLMTDFTDAFDFIRIFCSTCL